MQTVNPRRISTAKKPRATPKADPTSLSGTSSHPNGKLGQILGRVASKTGATVDELVAATGWQRHSVHGALSRLKARGFAIRLDTKANRKAYRLRQAG